MGMKPATVFQIAAILLAVVFCLPAHSQTSAQAPARKDHELALVDIQKVINQSVRGRQRREEFLKSVRARVAEVESYRKEVDTLNRQLAEKQKTLAAAQFEKHRADAERRVRDLQRKAEDISEELQRQEGRLASDLALDIKAVAADYARKKGYDLVLESGQHLIPYKTPSVDITDQIIREYDAAVSAPAPSLPAAPATPGRGGGKK